MRFKIHTVQTDNGCEFTNDPEQKERESLFEEILRLKGIRYKMTRPYSPWQNGKVERSHREDSKHFYCREFKSLNDLVTKHARYASRQNNCAKDEQLTSYEAQVDYYTAYINSREDWEFVEVYTDEGISGTNTKKREGFNRMIADALDGKIDLIITKSVSRFARNTVDSLTTIRKLKENGTEVYFEKESIWTFDSKGELLITIMSSLAQEESRSISENCTWGQRKRFADGKVTVPFKRFLGYDRGEDGNLVVNPDQAKLVKRIYGLFLQGYSPFGIAKLLHLIARRVKKMES